MAATFQSCGLLIFFTILGWSRPQLWNVAAIGYGAASIVALVGAGLSVAARFLPRPLANGDQSQGTSG